MNKKFIGLFVGTVFALSASLTHAIPMSYVFSETISDTNITGLLAGQTADITVTLDNGGSTDISQTWTVSDLLSVTFDFNGGSLVTTFNSPFDGGVTYGLGNFQTDGTGMLTSVMEAWYDDFVTADFVTTGAGTSFFWFLIGGNVVEGQVYTEQYTDSSIFHNVYINNVETIRDPAAWSKVTSQVPEPSTVALMSLGLVGLGFTRRRVKA